MLRGRFLFLLRQVSRDECALGFPMGPPPCVCGRDVIEVMHGLAAAASRGWLSLRESGGQLPGGAAGWRRRSHSSRTLWPGGSRSEWRPGWWPSGSPITPSGPGHCWYASSKNGHVKVRNIAQAIINAHCGRLSPAEVEILSVIEMHNAMGRTPNRCPSGRAAAHQRKFAVIGARHVPATMTAAISTEQWRAMLANRTGHGD